MKQLVNRMVIVQVPHPKTGVLQTRSGHVIGYTMKKDESVDDLLVKTWCGTVNQDEVVKVPFDSNLWRLRYPDKNARKA